jgi:hypothetical protein
MSRQISLSFPHNLTEAEAKSRLVRAIADAKMKHPSIMAGSQETWTGNRMDFRFTVMGQSVTGDVVVDPKTVLLHIHLPMILAMLADRIKPQIESEGRRLLAGPGDAAQTS